MYLIKKEPNKYSHCKNEMNFKKDILLNNIIGKLPIIWKNCQKYGKKSKKIKIEQFNNHLKNCNYSNYECLICNKKIEHAKKRLLCPCSYLWIFRYYL